MRSINNAGLLIIKDFETCRLDAYQDQRGVWTIGYGHTVGVTPGQVITQDTANDMLWEDLQNAETGVNKLVTHPINDNQFSALVSFAFNEGVGALETSTLLRLVNSGMFNWAADEFTKWDIIHIKGVSTHSKGLHRRRLAEQALFTKV